MLPEAASELKGDNVKGFEGFYLQAEASMWSYVPNSLDSGFAILPFSSKRGAEL